MKFCIGFSCNIISQSAPSPKSRIRCGIFWNLKINKNKRKTNTTTFVREQIVYNAMRILETFKHFSSVCRLFAVLRYFEWHCAVAADSLIQSYFCSLYFVHICHIILLYPLRWEILNCAPRLLNTVFKIQSLYSWSESIFIMRIFFEIWSRIAKDIIIGIVYANI